MYPLSPSLFMAHFVVWELRGVRFLAEREHEGSYYLTTIKRLA